MVSLEGVDARRIDRSMIPEDVTALVADVSFISLTKALGAPLGLTVPGAWLIALVKPQFEAGPSAVGKGGIVSDPSEQAAIRSRGRRVALGAAGLGCCRDDAVAHRWRRR